MRRQVSLRARTEQMNNLCSCEISQNLQSLRYRVSEKNMSKEKGEDGKEYWRSDPIRIFSGLRSP